MYINKVFAVAKWEFLGKVKTRAFIISVIVTPLILISLTIGGTLLSSATDSYTKVIGLIDTSGIYFQPMKEKVSAYTLEDGQIAYLFINMPSMKNSLQELKELADKRVNGRGMSGYIIINNAGKDSVYLEFRSNSFVKPADIDKLEKAFTETNNSLILKNAGVKNELIKKMSYRTPVTQILLNDKGSKNSSGFLITFFSSIIFIMLLITLVTTTGGMLVRNLVEEKSNKLIDIIISSCSPNELLTGKILGLSSVGFFQVLIWILMGIIFSIKYEIPLLAFENITLILFYFIFGFFLFTSIFVGIGSLLNTEQEAQQVTSYLSILMVFPIALALPALENPDFFLVKVLSYFPLTLPSVMILRLNLSQVSLIEKLVTMTILILSIVLTISISSRIFRIGILSHGKKPGLKELFTWLRDEK